MFVDQLGTRQLSLVFGVVAILSIWQVAMIPESPMYAVVGASTAPAALSVFFAALSFFYCIVAFRGKAPDSEESSEKALVGSGARLSFFLGGCFCLLALIKLAGFLLAATGAGMLIARSFDAPIDLKSLVICSLISLAFWLLFSALLGVDLGPLIIGVV